MKWLLRGLMVLGALVLLALAAVLAGQLGLLRGTPPSDLGVHEGRLKAPSNTPNSVSSQADLWPGHPQLAYARIAPLTLHGDGTQTMARLESVIAAMPGARVVARSDGYLRVEFTTPLMHFTDDAEFWLDRSAGVVQVRSASRLGKGDMGVNRRRIEAIRERLAAG